MGLGPDSLKVKNLQEKSKNKKNKINKHEDEEKEKEEEEKGIGCWPKFRLMAGCMHLEDVLLM